MMKLSYAVALPDCKAKKMQCFRGDLDTICAQLKALGYDGVELFARNPKGLDQRAIGADDQALRPHGAGVRAPARPARTV